MPSLTAERHSRFLPAVRYTTSTAAAKLPQLNTLSSVLPQARDAPLHANTTLTRYQNLTENSARRPTRIRPRFKALFIHELAKPPTNPPKLYPAKLSFPETKFITLTLTHTHSRRRYWLHDQASDKWLLEGREQIITSLRERCDTPHSAIRWQIQLMTFEMLFLAWLMGRMLSGVVL